MRSSLVLLAVLLACGLGGCSFGYGSRSHNASSLGDAGGRTSRLGEVSRAAGCEERGGLPDPRCTPGAVAVGVSLATICRYGYSRSVRPPEGYTESLKLRQMRAYGFAGRAAGYEEDHLVALSIGGAPRDPANLWPEPRGGEDNAGQKDGVETWAARTACGHRMSLGALQRAMAKDWVALYREAG